MVLCLQTRSALMWGCCRRVFALACLAGVSSAFVVSPAGPVRATIRMAAASGDEEWKSIVGSEANLGKYVYHRAGSFLPSLKSLMGI